ncbi:MAG: hypothetical protein EBZ49_00730 [Proteobacteria bacterium]|nr:hypothetical protein [Pseudomonadota bacterium]
MAKVKSVDFCSQCGQELSTSYPCSACGYNPAKVLKDLFEECYYITLQAKDIEAAAHKELKNDRAKEELIAKNKINIKNWFRLCPDELKVAAVSDALLVVQNLLVSNTKPNAIKQITSLARSIGDLAKIVDDYIKSGGDINALPATPRPNSSESDPQ